MQVKIKLKIKAGQRFLVDHAKKMIFSICSTIKWLLSLFKIKEKSSNFDGQSIKMVISLHFEGFGA